MKHEEISLAKLANGALEERFARVFQEMLQNIQDVNTNATAKRKVTIELIVTPSKDRSLGKVEIKTKTALPGAEAIETTVFMGFDGKKVVAREHYEEQGPLFPGNDKPLKEVPIGH